MTDPNYTHMAFLLDASGSMAARNRMVQVKTAVLSLLLDAYRRRDTVGLVTFRGTGATLALPPTNSVDVAAARLRELPAGGRTPLAEGLIEAAAFHQIECFEAAKLFAETEGTIPAPETSHAIRAAIVEALRCKETGKEECILFNFSGHGICDLSSYDRFFAGALEDFAYPQDRIERALAQLPVIE